MNLNNLSKNQKLGLLILGLVLILGLLFVPYLKDYLGGDRQEASSAEVAEAIPDAEVEEPDQSKLASYTNTRKTTQYWEDLYEAQQQQEDADDIPVSSPPASGGSSRGAITSLDGDDVYKQIVEDIPSTSSAPASRPSGSSSSSRGGSSSTAPKPGDPGYHEYRMKQYYDNAEEAVRQGEAIKRQQQEQAARQPQAQSEPEPEQREPMTTLGDTASVRRTETISNLASSSASSSSGFSSLDDEQSVPSGADYPFECMFVRAEKLRSGSRVSVRLLEDMVVGGTLIPKNTHLMAMCSINERLELVIQSVEMGSKIYQLGYEAYDKDGAKGIYCPDLNKEARRAVENRGLSSIGSLIGGRVGRLASDAVNTGVSIAQNKSGEVTVSVPAGYRFFIVRNQRR